MVYALKRQRGRDEFCQLQSGFHHRTNGQCQFYPIDPNHLPWVLVWSNLLADFPAPDSEKLIGYAFAKTNRKLRRLRQNHFSLRSASLAISSWFFRLIYNRVSAGLRALRQF
jgi:hypothetical protein